MSLRSPFAFLRVRHLLGLVAFFILTASVQSAESYKILLVGDSTTIGSLPRELNPDGPQLEGMMELIASIEGLPKLEVINAGKGGDTAKRLLGSKWYAEQIQPVADVDTIILRMGINDWFKCDDFHADYPGQMKALIAQLQADHPQADVILATICRFMPHEECVEVNDEIKALSVELNLKCFDLYTPYNQYLTDNGPNSLNVRQPYLDQIPEGYHAFLKPYTHFRKGWGNKPSGNVVKVDDTSLDPLFGDTVKSWYFDRHPNTEGYNLIALETVKFLKSILR